MGSAFWRHASCVTVGGWLGQPGLTRMTARPARPRRGPGCRDPACQFMRTESGLALINRPLSWQTRRMNEAYGFIYLGHS